MEGQRETTRIFLLSHLRKFSIQEKEQFTKIIKSLGGICRPEEDMYVSDCTHVIMPSEILKSTQWCPKIFGALASKKTFHLHI